MIESKKHNQRKDNGERCGRDREFWSKNWTDRKKRVIAKKENEKNKKWKDSETGNSVSHRGCDRDKTDEQKVRKRGGSRKERKSDGDKESEAKRQKILGRKKKSKRKNQNSRKRHILWEWERYLKWKS